MTPSGGAKLRRVFTQAALPTGTVTFVLADVEGSVALREARPIEMAAAIREFDDLVADLVNRHGGARSVEQEARDSFVAAFSTAHQALLFAAELQVRLGEEEWARALPIRARVALHTGAAQLRDGTSYMGPAINRGARIRGLAHGGQVLLSAATTALVIDDPPSGVSVRNLGAYKLRDFARAEQVWQLVHAGLDDEFPPLRDEPVSSNLPAGLTSFIARDAELALLGRMFDEGRLVTLTGAGGSGKTRLAIEFARRVAQRFVDGVAFADAAPIGDPALVVSCVASAVGVQESPGEPLIETVARQLADHQLLLLLDNCEHVIDAAAEVVERILNGADGLRVIATSREPLGIVGEVSMRVPSLDADAAALLFEDRARATVPNLVLSDAAQHDVRTICERLDGIPLAIELAAARTRVLTTRQIADGIVDRFGLLTGGARTALPRQRTLEASVEWSYRLLSNIERILLNRLSVFAGDFRLEAARQVCSADPIKDGDVFDLLTALVDKSLVQAHAPTGDSEELRYRMLETIRHFARQRLSDGPDAEDTRDRHLAFFVDFAEVTAPGVEVGSEHVAALARLAADLDNFRAAREWARQRGDADRLLRLMAALWLFHEVRSEYDEAVTWLRAALDAAPDATTQRGLAMYGLGDISIFTLDIATVAAAGEEVVAIGDLLEDEMMRTRGRMLLAWASAFGYGDPEWGVETFGEIVAFLRDAENPWLETDAAIGLCSAALFTGDFARAVEGGRWAVASAHRDGIPASLLRGTFYLGFALALTGRLTEAEPALLEAVAIADDLNESFFRALSLATLSMVYTWQSRHEEGVATARTAVGIAQRSGSAFAIGMGTTMLVRALAEGGDEAAALAMLDDARALLERFEHLRLGFVTEDTAVVRAMVSFGDDADAARAALSSVYETAIPGAQGLVALARGWLERRAGDEAAAETFFTAALADSARSSSLGDVLAALHELGVSAETRNQLDRAVRLYASADASSTELGVEPRPRPAALGPRTADCERLRSVLGGDAFGAEWAVGSALTLEQAIHFALRGKGGRRRSTTGWESLTPTEMEVVRYVTEGLSNPAIAERMLITRGTVKVHLSHVFTKLNVTSRAELAAEATRRGVT